MTLTAPPKLPATHKKRSGQHHRHNKPYLKTYWPYLPMLAIVGLGLILNNTLSKPQNVLGYATDISAQTLLNDTNLERANYHEKALSSSPMLDQAAQAKAADMAARDYWSHNTPDGNTPWSFISKTGYQYQRAGENLAYGFNSSDQTVTAWMNSPEHRQNILNSNYTQVGFGIINIADYHGSGPETLVVAFYTQPIIVTAASAPVTHQTAPLTNNVQKFSEPASQPVARIQLLTNGQAPWSLFALSVLSTVAVAIFIIRHGLLWHRALVKSEAFIIHHPLLDLLIVSLGTVGFVLTQAAGVIR